MRRCKGTRRKCVRPALAGVPAVATARLWDLLGNLSRVWPCSVGWHWLPSGADFKEFGLQRAHWSVPLSLQQNEIVVDVFISIVLPQSIKQYCLSFTSEPQVKRSLVMEDTPVQQVDPQACFYQAVPAVQVRWTLHAQNMHLQALDMAHTTCAVCFLSTCGVFWKHPPVITVWKDHAKAGPLHLGVKPQWTERDWNAF